MTRTPPEPATGDDLGIVIAATSVLLLAIAGDLSLDYTGHPYWVRFVPLVLILIGLIVLLRSGPYRRVRNALREDDHHHD
jgi:membrane protein YdbS with pleckstrin-like domain